MHVLIAQQGFSWQEQPEYRVLAIFKDPLVALREKRKIENAISLACKKGKSTGQFAFMQANVKHPYWKYVQQLDPGYTPFTDDTTYHIQEAKIKTVL